MKRIHRKCAFPGISTDISDITLVITPEKRYQVIYHSDT